MKRFVYICLLALLPSLLFAQVYTGGSYDGYDNGLPGVLRFGYPQVVSDAATNVTDQSAWLNGTLLSTGSAETVVWVYWGAANCGTNKTAWAHEESFGVCGEGQALTTNVTGLTPNSTYYYSFYASNAVGEYWSASMVEIPSSPVLDAGLCATPVSRTGARLNGALTNGTSADIKIYFGQNTNNWASTNSLGTRVEGAFYVNVSGLTAGSVYYYRCYGTNTYGECWADTIAFTTQVDCAGVFLGGSYDGYDVITRMVRFPYGIVIIVR